VVALPRLAASVGAVGLGASSLRPRHLSGVEAEIKSGAHCRFRLHGASGRLGAACEGAGSVPSTQCRAKPSQISPNASFPWPNPALASLQAWRVAWWFQ
jgi:hypothetical protein